MTRTMNRQGWRIAGWGGLLALLAVPAVAMRFDTGFDWSLLDFVVAGVLLGSLGLGVETAARFAGGVSAKLGMAVAALAAILLVWINLAVGVIGSEANDANLLFAGVLAVATGGAMLARFEPAGMARAMVATAGAQTLVGLIALVFALGEGGARWPWDLVGASVLFDGLWLLAAALFHRETAR